MSFVQVIIVKGDQFFVASMHFRTAMKVLADVEKTTDLLRSRHLDAGYILIDADRKIMINGQSAFPLGHVQRKKGMEIFEA